MPIIKTLYKKYETLYSGNNWLEYITCYMNVKAIICNSNIYKFINF